MSTVEIYSIYETHWPDLYTTIIGLGTSTWMYSAYSLCKWTVVGNNVMYSYLQTYLLMCIFPIVQDRKE